MPEQPDPMDVVERTAQWEENRRKKITDIQEKKSNLGMEECTFRPKLVSERGSELTKTSQLEA